MNSEWFLGVPRPCINFCTSKIYFRPFFLETGPPFPPFKSRPKNPPRFPTCFTPSNCEVNYVTGNPPSTTETWIGFTSYFFPYDPPLQSIAALPSFFASIGMKLLLRPLHIRIWNSETSCCPSEPVFVTFLLLRLWDPC